MMLLREHQDSGIRTAAAVRAVFERPAPRGEFEAGALVEVVRWRVGSTA